MLRTAARCAPLSLIWFLCCLATARGDATIQPAAKYEAVAKALETFIGHEIEDKRLPALSIALVDDQQIVWARGFGFADPKAKTPATAETVYRVGSVSKLFTDIAVMRLVEQGKLDLDAPVTNYLPDFKPENPFDKPITLRQMMAHRSGLVREPPVGSYFDPTNPTLAQMVESLNRTKLVYKPEQKTKYSNAAIATVGYVLERTQKEPFAKYLQRTLLNPLGMTSSGFEPRPELTKNLARAVMWTYQGREFPPPMFELGMAPAGSMYSTVLDLGRFTSVLFADGKGPNERMLKKESLEQMWTPQFRKSDDKSDFGIGFRISEFEGHRRLGHGGAIYGFATDLSLLPEDKLGVVVITSKDVANAVTTHIADEALKLMLAIKQGKSLPKVQMTKPVDPERAAKLAGRYRSGEKVIDLIARDGKLWVLPARGGFRAELRSLGEELIVDDVLDHGLKIAVDGDKLRIGKDVYEHVAVAKPGPCPAKWLGLIGEYGWDHDILYILEKDGKLHALIEWFFLYPLTEQSENVYQFPDFGLYHDEKLVFTRDDKGKATQVEAANVVFKRRHIDGEAGRTFKIAPRRPIDGIRREALAAAPPPEPGEFAKPDLVELVKLDYTINLDIRYATTNNFLSTPFYQSAKAYLQRPAAEALVRVHKKLADQGFGLLIHDGYRPWNVTKMFWDATPDAQRIFVADPSKGSRHNRGCAVDLTLYDRKTGKAIEMVGGYDEMSDRSYPEYMGGTSLQRWHRDLLRSAMEAEGFTVYEAEWWHFDYKDWKKYAISNRTFEEVDKVPGGEEKPKPGK
jgi:CubicO group peptidase (beta-lactamase class C family)/D-alanyl-D-alanine dipeptidase